MCLNHRSSTHQSADMFDCRTGELRQQQRPTLNDLGNALRFIELFFHIVRYVPARGWFLFVETHWQPADTDTMLSLARQSLEGFLDSTRHLVEEESEFYERILKHIDRSQSLSRLQALLRLVRTFPDLILPYTALDADPYLLNLRNGTFDLRSGELLPHNSQHYLTRLLPYDFDPSAASPIWDSFLDRLTNSDPILRYYLQRAVGSTLFGASNESTCFVLTGPGQRAHHLFLNTLRQLLGSYATHPHSLKERTLSPTLLTSRLLTFNASVLVRADPSILSAFLNHEPLTIAKASTELLYQPHPTLWLSAPEIPQLPADLCDYLQPIPLSLSLSSYESAQLQTQLQTVLPAILNWAIDGFQFWYTEAPTEPPCIQQASTAFREQQDPFATFLAQSCIAEPNSTVPVNEFYQAYVIWARASGERPLSASRFASRAHVSGLESTSHASSRFYQDLKLIQPTSSSLEEVHKVIDT